MAIRRTSPGFTRGSSSFRGVTQHKSGVWPHLALPGPSLPNAVHVSDAQNELNIPGILPQTLACSQVYLAKVI